MDEPIVREQEEIDEVLDAAREEFVDSRLSGLTYEDGIIRFYEWLVGLTDVNPMDDA